MRRSLGLVALVLAARAAPALADPLDFDLERLGAPTTAVWDEIAKRHPALTIDSAALATSSRQRFALLSTQLGLALSSFVLAPASTTGQLGYEIDLETAYAPVSSKAVGVQLPELSAGAFPVRSAPPSFLLLPAVHVRKSLPSSVELGGRAIYLNQSQLTAAQAEVKWAVNEAWWYLPDFAVRGALTHLFGQRDLDLTTADLDLMVGRRFGVGGVVNLTPYAAFRLTWVGASSDRIDFAPSPVDFPDQRPPAQVVATQAAFPELKMSQHLFPRYTVGVRLVAAAVSIAAEGCYFAGKTFTGPAGDETRYPTFAVPSSFSASGKVGLEF
jgi:hypothetical protein